MILIELIQDILIHQCKYIDNHRKVKEDNITIDIYKYYFNHINNINNINKMADEGGADVLYIIKNRKENIFQKKSIKQ